MTAKGIYKCDQCKGRKEIADGDAVPECCGKSMVIEAEPLEQCTLSGTAEHSRMDDMGEPCDDGRAGK